MYLPYGVWLVCIQFNFEDLRISAVANMATSRGKYTQAFSVPELAQINSNSLNDTHMVNIAVVNSFILVQIHQARDPDDEQLQRNKILLLSIVRNL